MRLCVRGLPDDVNDDDVRARFAPFGDVRSVDLIRDTALGGQRCRGFAFVEMEATEAEMARCIKVYAGARWRGRLLSIEAAHPSYMDRLRGEWADAESYAAMEHDLALETAEPEPFDLTQGAGRHTHFDERTLGDAIELDARSSVRPPESTCR